jgi:hypothetical protein
VQSESVVQAELHPACGVGESVSTGVFVGVFVDTGVLVGVFVDTGVSVGVCVGVNEPVGVNVAVIEPVGVKVGVARVNVMVHAADTAFGFSCGTFGATGLV